MRFDHGFIVWLHSVNYGDRLIFKNADWWADNDDCWLVPKEIYDTCDFRVNNRTYAKYYIDDMINWIIQHF